MTGAVPAPQVTYRLAIVVARSLRLEVGRLGFCEFPAGRYAYIGSARRNLVARIRRHLGETRRRLHWHIDYLLAAPGVSIDGVDTFATAECEVVRRTGGEVRVPGFGSSDCRQACRSHLRYFGDGSPP